ncbi:MAG: DUF3299 domain-containing protein [Rickettsiales bacterium]|jgi:putative ABC transport system permease protein|nr:DUF3299 domain-containing protein [Rickettsiales bacterium]
MLLKISIKSALNRKFVLFLLVFSITISTILLLGISKIKTQTENSFLRSVSGTDLIVGARGSSIQLILYSIFHLGGATNNISGESVKHIMKNDYIKWGVPISLGDNHKNFPVVATNNDFFEHYKYGDEQFLQIDGSNFQDEYGVIVGHEVAKKMQYHVNSMIKISHSKVVEHEEKFNVIGILRSTGTPIDKSIFITLQAMDDIHLGFTSGIRQPKQYTALLIGLKNKTKIFSLQREINKYNKEPLTAILPGVALGELWNLLSIGEKTLTIISALVAFCSLLGLSATILAGLNERKQEISVLRMLGASPKYIGILYLLEGLFVVVVGIMIGVVILFISFMFLKNSIMLQYGILLEWNWTLQETWIVVKIFIMGIVVMLIPAIKSCWLVIFLVFTSTNIFAAKYQKIEWKDLIPVNYNEEKEFAKINWEKLEEDDEKMQKEIQRILDDAPTDKKWDKKMVEIQGYISPLDYGQNGFKEFFVVPYFGACIHSPPPPANQIIYIKAKTYIDNHELLYDAITVKGELEVGNKNTEMGVSGYIMKVDYIQ